MKPTVKIRDWWITGNRLLGQIDEHPKLGPCGKTEVIQTSAIVSIETRNTIYVIDGPPRSASHHETQMLKTDTGVL